MFRFILFSHSTNTLFFYSFSYFAHFINSFYYFAHFICSVNDVRNYVYEKYHS